MNETSHHEDQPDFSKILLATGIGILILGGITFAGYKYSQKKAGVTLPGGVTYLGPTPQGQPQPNVPSTFTVDQNVQWNTMGGKTYNYAFSYPVTLPLVVYTGDPTDTVSIAWGTIPPQQNVLAKVFQIADFNSKYVSLPKEQYVNDWWQQYSGLKGVKSVTPFTNASGMKGYRARYIDYADQAAVDNVFFEVPNNPNVMLHFANGILDPLVFERIVQSVTWITASPGATTNSPTPQAQ